MSTSSENGALFNNIHIKVKGTFSSDVSAARGGRVPETSAVHTHHVGILGKNMHLMNLKTDEHI